MPPENSQQYYAIAKLEEAARAVKQAVNELPLLRKRLEKFKDNKPKAREIYNDLKQQHEKLLSALNTAALSLLETEQSELVEYSVKLSNSVKAFNLITPDYSKLCAVLSDYISKLPTTANAATIGHLMSAVKMGYYPTDIEHVKYLEQGIEFPEDITVNLFDPCCGCGLALRTLAGENNCLTYGVELDKHRAEEALTRLNRVAFGTYFQSRISNEAFHLMLLNPPYLSVITEGGNNSRSEKSFLIDSISHLIYGGLLIYIIPYYRLTPDICRVLCDNFEDLTVWKFMGEEFKRFKQVAILGKRIKRRDGSELVSELAELALKPDSIAEISELPSSHYSLPKIEKNVELFKGAEFNVAELAEQLSRSKSFSRLFEKSKLDNEIKRPLLPLNIGQVGLIGGSGLINGLVECDTPHIIKGRIVKENTINKEENMNSKGEIIGETVHETRSNKMIFNLLTPQGFLSLSDYEEEKPVKSNLPLTLGRTVITANAKNILSDSDIATALSRHQSGDWGELCEEDREVNEDALENGFRIMSVYTSKNGIKFWIITEADRSCTTVLMPEDY